MIHGRGPGLTAGLARTTTHLASALHDSVFPEKQTITSEVLPSRTKISRKKKKAEKNSLLIIKNIKKLKKGKPRGSC